MGRHLGRRAVGEAGSRGGADARPRRDDALPRDSNYSQAVDLVGPAALGRFIDAAHADGLRVVAWYLPSFKNVARDLAARARRSDSGRRRARRSTRSRSTSRRSRPLGEETPARLLALSRPFASAVGRQYPLGAIIPSPVGMRAASGLLAAVPVRGPRADLRRLPADGLLHLPDEDRPATRAYTEANWRSCDARPATIRSSSTPSAAWPAARRSPRCARSRAQPRTRALSARASMTTQRRALRNGARSALPPESLGAGTLGGVGSAVVAALISIVGLATGPKPGVQVWTGTPAHLGTPRTVPGATSPVLSPDGKRVAGHALSGELRVQPVGGGPVRTLTQVPGKDPPLAWSPDAARIAFPSEFSIVLLPVLGKGPVRLVRLPKAWEGSTLTALQWSPDGSKLAFSRTSGDGKKNTLRNELDVIGVDGKGARTLHVNPARTAPARSRPGRRTASASPSIWTSSAWRRSRSPAARARPSDEPTPRRRRQRPDLVAGRPVDRLRPLPVARHQRRLARAPERDRPPPPDHHPDPAAGRRSHRVDSTGLVTRRGATPRLPPRPLLDRRCRDA